MRSPTFKVQTAKRFSFSIPYTPGVYECKRECRVQKSAFRLRPAITSLHPTFTSGNASVGRARASAGCNPQPVLRNSSGFVYIALLAALVIIGISLGAAGKYWQSVVLRDKEEELLFRGDQYRQAIERYYAAIPTIRQFPPSIDDLLKDSRTPSGKRHLRQKYKDPFTGEDFIEIREALSKRIIGVRSGSDRTPLKQANFPDQFQDFAGKNKYSDWQFLAVIKPGQQTLPGGPAVRSGPLPAAGSHPVIPPSKP